MTENRNVLTDGELTEIDMMETVVSAVDQSQYKIDMNGIIYLDGNPCVFRSQKDYEDCKEYIKNKRWMQ